MAVDALGRIVFECADHPTYGRTAAEMLGEVKPEEKCIPAIRHLASCLQAIDYDMSDSNQGAKLRRWIGVMRKEKGTQAPGTLQLVRYDPAMVSAGNTALALSKIGRLSRPHIPLLFQLAKYLDWEKDGIRILRDVDIVAWKYSVFVHNWQDCTPEHRQLGRLWATFAPQLASTYQMLASDVLRYACEILGKDWEKEGTSLLQWWESEGKNQDY